MKATVLLTSMLVIMGTVVPNSHGSFLGTYNDLGTGLYDSYIAPPGQGNPNDGQDIIAVRYGESAAHHYFQIELEAAPSASAGGEVNFAGLYGVYIDADNNSATGADGQSWDYVPDAISGIELILDSHYDFFWGGYQRSDKHIYSDGSFENIILTGPETHEENGAFLEWAIAKTELAGPFSITVASHDDGSSAPTYDIEGSWVIPEPTSAMLMTFVGYAGFFIRKRLRG